MTLEKSDLSTPYSKFVHNREYCDAIFICQTQRFYTHKIVLASHSEYFKGLFSFPTTWKYDLKQNFDGQCDSDVGKDVYDVSDVTPETFLAILQHCYDCLDFEETEIDALELLEFADRYMLSSLKDTCISLIAQNLDSDNVLAVLTLTQGRNMRGLALLCTSYISKHFQDVVSTPAFIDLCQTQPHLVQNLCKYNTATTIRDKRKALLSTDIDVDIINFSPDKTNKLIEVSESSQNKMKKRRAT